MRFFGFYDKWKPTYINCIVCFHVSQKTELSSCMPLMFGIFFKKINLENYKPYSFNDNLLMWNLPEIAEVMIFKNVCSLHFAMNYERLLFFITAKVTFLCNQCCLHGNGGWRFSNEVSCLCCDLLFDGIWRDPFGSYLGTREGSH